MVKLANTYGSGPYVARLAGSSPVTRTIAQSLMYQGFGHFLVPLGVEINPRFYRGKKKALAKPKTARTKPPK